MPLPTSSAQNELRQKIAHKFAGVAVNIWAQCYRVEGITHYENNVNNFTSIGQPYG